MELTSGHLLGDRTGQDRTRQDRTDRLGCCASCVHRWSVCVCVRARSEEEGTKHDVQKKNVVQTVRD